jgi:hypothetical protein
MDECDTYLAREECRNGSNRLSAGWLILSHSNPSTMVIVPVFPPLFPLSRPQPIRELRDPDAKEIGGKEVFTYISWTCSQSMVTAHKHSLHLVSQTSDHRPSTSPINNSAFSRSSLSPLTSRLSTHPTLDPILWLLTLNCYCVCMCVIYANGPGR